MRTFTKSGVCVNVNTHNILVIKTHYVRESAPGRAEGSIIFRFWQCLFFLFCKMQPRLFQPRGNGFTFVSGGF
jgi:hypothetical protein